MGNDPSNPNGLEHSLPEYAEDAVEAWSEPPGSPNDRPWVFGTWGNNAPEDKLGIGLPFYGRTLDDGPTKPANAFTYSELFVGGTTTDGNYYTYQSRSVWTSDTDLAAQRVEFAHERELQHVIIWELGQDLHPSNPNSLLRAAYDARQSLVRIPGDHNGDGTVDAADYALWRSDPDSYDGDPQGYVDWMDNFGPAPGSGSGLSAVPEPVTAMLLLLVSMLLVLGRQSGCMRSAKFSG